MQGEEQCNVFAQRKLSGTGCKAWPTALTGKADCAQLSLQECLFSCCCFLCMGTCFSITTIRYRRPSYQALCCSSFGSKNANTTTTSPCIAGMHVLCLAAADSCHAGRAIIMQRLCTDVQWLSQLLGSLIRHRKISSHGRRWTRRQQLMLMLR